MNPWWLWWWAPQLHFPLSGSVAQHIEPDFVAGIQPEAGNGRIERYIHEDIASYGRQLGLITEVVLSLAGSSQITSQQASKSIGRLQQIHSDVEALKSRRRQRLEDSAVQALEKLAAADPRACEQVLQRFSPRLLGHSTPGSS